MSANRRRGLVAVVGDANLPAGHRRLRLASEAGRLLVEAGFRVVTGGLGGVMASAMKGAKTANSYVDGSTIAILPGYDPAEANAAADIVLATGLGIARNLVVANSDGVLAIGGGAGTLSEIALAWQLRRPVVALAAGGWSEKLAGIKLDKRVRQKTVQNDQVFFAKSAAQAVALLTELVPLYIARLRKV